jgi:hypothetical protein
VVVGYQPLTERSLKMNDTSREMPRYRCHKEVWALKIKDIIFDSDLANTEGRETDGSAMVVPSDVGYAPFRVDRAYVQKHQPKVGGYYVVYQYGYKSWSPADAFESGYTKI